jgi:hypothetical protein
MMSSLSKKQRSKLFVKLLKDVSKMSESEFEEEKRALMACPHHSLKDKMDIIKGCEDWRKELKAPFN